MDDVLDGSSDARYQDAIERAGKLLARGPRTEHQLRQRLEGAGIERASVDRALARLRDLGLVDDLAYARRWIEERTLRLGRGAEALMAELEAKGVDRGTAEKAMAEVDLDEAAVARSWAIRLLIKVQHRPLTEQGPRLRTMLVRRGFTDEAARAGALAVLPPEGWD